MERILSLSSRRVLSAVTRSLSLSFDPLRVELVANLEGGEDQMVPREDCSVFVFLTMTSDNG